MARVLTAAGETREISPANGRTFELAELQALVGGDIEALRAPGGQWLIINEDGKGLDLPFNRIATALMAPRLAWADDWIAGVAVLCSPTEAGAGDPG